MLSIITPVLNGADYIEETIKSIQKLCIPYEHIVVDGGSSDATIEIVRRFDNVKLVFQSKQAGMYAAIQQGIEESQGEFVTYVNCDDLIVKEGYEAMYITAINEDIDFVYSDSEEFYPNLNKRVLVRARLFAKYFLRKGYMPFVQPSSIYKRQLIMRIGGFNFEEFKISGDLDLFQRLAFDRTVSFCRINVLSSVFLKHGNSLGDRNSSIAITERASLRNYRMTFLSRILFYLLKYI